MYANMNQPMIRALEEARREAALRANPRPSRAAPMLGAMRLAAGKALVKAGNRLAPEAVPATPVTSTPC